MSESKFKVGQVWRDRVGIFRVIMKMTDEGFQTEAPDGTIAIHDENGFWIGQHNPHAKDLIELITTVDGEPKPVAAAKCVQVKVKKLHPDAILPTYATDGSACFDLHAFYIDSDGWKVDRSMLHGDAVTFRTGLSFEIPAGWAMMIYSRSGHGFKAGVRLSNAVGVIDSDFRGEVMVRLKKDESGMFEVNHGDRIAQAMLIPVPRVEFIEVDELSDTERGGGGFGSTGA